MAGLRAKLLIKITQQENEDRQNGGGPLEREDVPQPGLAAWPISHVVGRKPKRIAPDIDEQRGQRAEHIETDRFDGNNFLPAIREGVAVELDAKHGSVVWEGEEAQPKKYLQQNTAAGNEPGGQPERPALRAAFPPASQPQGEHQDGHNEEGEAPRIVCLPYDDCG